MRKFTAIPGHGIFARSSIANKRKVLTADEHITEVKYMKKLRKVVASSSKQIFRVWYNPYNYPDEEDYIDVNAVDEDEARRKARSLGYVTEVELKEDITAARKISRRQSIKASTYNGFDESEFNEKQLEEIREGLDEGLDVSQYADSKFGYMQMYYIRKGLEEGLDVSWYADPKYYTDQMRVIREGLRNGVDVSLYADPRFDDYQMYEIRQGLLSGIDAGIYADPKFDDKQMEVLRKGLEAGIDVTPYADPTIRVKAMRDAIFPKSKKSWSSVKKQLEYDAQDVDPLHDQTDAGAYVENLMYGVQDDLEVQLEGSTQGGVGEMFFFSTNDGTQIADPVDYMEFDEDVVNLALESKSEKDFKNKYKAYLQSIINK